MPPRVLVTGGLGYLGSIACEHLLAAGYAVTALGLVAVAVLGDGYFEVFKHVWLAAYVLLVTGLCLVGALGAGVVPLATGRRRREPERAN